MQSLTASSAIMARQLVRRPQQTVAAPVAVMARLFALQQQQRGYATPMGPPPKGFRLEKTKTWDQDPESTLDKAGRYFLLSEMFRGMYVALEQYFRPPYVELAPGERYRRKKGLSKETG